MASELDITDVFRGIEQRIGKDDWNRLMQSATVLRGGEQI